MKLSQIRIQNFRSCRDVTLYLDGLHALVGTNNAGKSCILRALDFLFNPATRSLSEESFWNRDTNAEIRIEALFSQLTELEKQSLTSLLKPDGTFHMARSAKLGIKSGEAPSDDGADKITISQEYMVSVPKLEWLQDSNINSTNISKWWRIKDQLLVADACFASLFADTNKKPSVEEWKEKAKEFVLANEASIPTADSWIQNPKGYANVLKGALPFFILVPAVREAAEESKGTKTSPFGKLLSAILNTVGTERKKEIERVLTEISQQMNRTGGEKRVPLIANTERDLNTLLGDFFGGCDLEIEFQTPTLESLLSAPRLFIDDGFRNSIENKGHGLQRAVIFTILRRYAEFVTSAAEGRNRSLILAIEEPELYMHPQAQRTIRRVLRKVVTGGDQVIFCTHSSLLVDVAYFDEIIRVESVQQIVNGRKTTESKAWQLPMQKMIDDLETRVPKIAGKITPASLRDLYSHAYNPRRNEGFFASKIILVEGLTEEYSLPIYADALQECAFDPRNISVVECGGKGAMDRLFRIFNELHIPCYLILDYDSGNQDKNIINKSKELLKLAGESPEEPKTVLIADRITCFKSKWETDLRTEIPDVEALTAQAGQELGGDVGKPLVARYIARKLTARTQPFVPPSLEAIIRKASAIDWKQSCLESSLPILGLDTKGIEPFVAK
jgi:putative ATP-dependent endonuclease of OLD family